MADQTNDKSDTQEKKAPAESKGAEPKAARKQPRVLAVDVIHLPKEGGGVKVVEPGKEVRGLSKEQLEGLKANKAVRIEESEE